MLETQRLASLAVGAVHEGRNLNAALAESWGRHPQLSAQQRGAITDLSHGALRFGHRLEAILDPLLAKPLRDPALRALLLVALYQLLHTRAAPHAIVDHAVSCAARLGAPHASGLINAVLRNFLRRRGAFVAAASQETEPGRYCHPQWWIDRLRTQYPHHYGAILAAGNQRPPFTLRVNRRRATREGYCALLAAQGITATVVGQDAITITPAMPVERVPGFAVGTVSVQDAAAQIAAPLLDAQDGMLVLDACAAPGGKTTHLLEIADVDLVALDSDAPRLQRVQQNLDRLGLTARLQRGDARDPTVLGDARFARILADVPCSASGVVRRHPDIKWLRRARDIAQFSMQQRRMLDALWQLLASGGKLLYTTCSVFQEENSQQIAEFLARHSDARRLPLGGVITLDGIPDGQLLPDSEHDGFFYALLQKP